MFQGLGWRASRALASICGGSVSSPLVSDDVCYLDFFTKVMERFEAGAQQVGVLIEEESRDLVSQALTRLFSNLLRSNPHFDFEAAMAPVPKAICGALGKAVRDHVESLRAQFAPDNLEVQGALRET
ncbi:hypothetical protein D1007_33414 [Hordeum vulgare]|nr:hypothetical protein D1007_33414 [Hordeum vulgare]